MDKDTVIRNLCDAFETIKDSWETKKDAIINCIVETELYDGDLAMDMWLYILNKEGECVGEDGVKYIYFGLNYKMEECIGDVFKAFFYKYEKNKSPFYMCKVLFDHIVPHIIMKDQLLEILFEKSHNMSYYTEITDYSDFPPYVNKKQYENDFIPALIACILLLDNPVASIKIMKYMINEENSYNWDGVKEADLFYLIIPIGKIIRLTKDYIQSVYRNKDIFNQEYRITKRVKEAMLSCVDRIECAENRAECIIEILSL